MKRPTPQNCPLAPNVLWHAYLCIHHIYINKTDAAVSSNQILNSPGKVLLPGAVGPPKPGDAFQLALKLWDPRWKEGLGLGNQGLEEVSQLENIINANMSSGHLTLDGTPGPAVCKGAQKDHKRANVLFHVYETAEIKLRSKQDEDGWRTRQWEAGV